MTLLQRRTRVGDGITAHLREDRRHIRDEDMERLKRQLDRIEAEPTDEEIAAAAEAAAAHASEGRPSPSSRVATAFNAARTYRQTCGINAG